MSTVLSAGTRQRDPAAFLVRRVLPGAVVITVGTAWLRYYADASGLIGDAAGVTLMTLFCVSMISALSLWSARQIRAAARTDREVERGRLYRMIAQNYPDGGIFLFDQDLRYVLAEAKGLELIGLSSAALEGRTIFEVLEPEALTVLEPAYRGALAGNTTAFEMSLRGEHYRVVVAPVREDSGAIPGGLVVTARVTTEKQLQDQLNQAQKMEAIGQLAGGVAHDFNNLLVAIRGYADMIQRRPGDARSDGWVAEILKASDHASALTRQLLAFSRKQPLQPRLLDLNACVIETKAMLGRLLGAGIEIVTAFDDKLGAVTADPGHVNQVLVNLAVNARDAMPEGGRLTIETRNVILEEEFAGDLGAAPGDYAVLAVSDTGQGMDAETCARIFEPFFTTKTEGRGTGLGLSTVYGIVKQTGGHTSVYSEPGNGTTFRIYLPVTDGAERTDPLPVRPRSSTALGARVLVVDDDEVVRGIIGEMLRENGYDADVVADATEALGHCERARYDLLVTDMAMPGTDGRATAEAISTRQPHIRVLFTSGYTSNAMEARRLPPNCSFLSKPFTMNELVAAVSELLEQGAAELALGR